MLLKRLLNLNRKTIITYILVLLVVSSFIVFGIVEFIQNSGGAKVASVDGYNISQQEYSDYINNRISAITKGGNTNIQKYANTPEFRFILLNELINKYLIRAELRDLKILINKNVVREYIRKSKTFAKDGAFDPILFKTYLQQIGMSEGDFIENQIQNFENVMFDKVLGLIKLNEKDTLINLYKASYQDRIIDIYRIPMPSQLDSDSYIPSDTELMQIYEVNKQNFVEKAGKIITLFDLSQYVIKDSSSIKISEEEIIKYYKDNYTDQAISDVRPNIISTLQKQRVCQVADLYKQRLSDDMSSGESLSSSAKKLSLHVKENVDFSSIKHSLPANIVDIIDASTDTQYGEVIKEDGSECRYVAYQITSIIPARPKEIKEVRGKLIEMWRKQKRSGMIETIAKNAYKTLKDGGGEIQLTEDNIIVRKDVKISTTSTGKVEKAALMVSKSELTPLIKEEDGSYVFAKVTDIKLPEGIDSQKMSILKEKLQKEHENEIASLYLSSLRQKFDVKINMNLLGAEEEK